MRDSDHWGQRAKRLKEGIETRAAERSNPGTGMGVSVAEVMAVLVEMAEMWRECEDELNYDAISGVLMINELVDAARMVDI